MMSKYGKELPRLYKKSPFKLIDKLNKSKTYKYRTSYIPRKGYRILKEKR